MKAYTSMKGRRVHSAWHKIEGMVVRWEPLSSAMCDCLVRRGDGSEVWLASSDLKPTDNLGPLPARREAITEAERRMQVSLRAIAGKWKRDFS
jgi:hypothetical protein